MLAADSDLQVGTRLASPFGRHLYQLPNAFAIENRKRILLDDSIREVGGQNPAHIVARKAKGGLREIVSTKGEELRYLGDFIGDQGGARQLDHCADEVLDRASLFCEDFFRYPVDDLRLVRHFIQRGDERDHHFGIDLAAVLGNGNGRLEDGAHLHFGDLGIGDSETATAKSEHGVELVQAARRG